MGDNITRPDHYCDGREYEPKDVIWDWGLNFNLGSAVKYISRAGRKGDKLEDLKKAKQFLEFEIEAEEEAQKKASKEAFYKSLEALDEWKATLMAKRKKRFTDLNTGKDIWLEIEAEEKSDIGMTCKEAAEIGEAIAKGLEDGIKEAKEKYDQAEENLDAIERKISWYANWITSDVLNGKMKFEDVPEDLKHIVIDKIAQEVLDNQCDITMNMPTIELRDMVIDRIVERINNGELDRMDIPTDTYEYCKRIREAIANREYRQTMDIATKCTENTIHVVINFNDKED